MEKNFEKQLRNNNMDRTVAIVIMTFLYMFVVVTFLSFCSISVEAKAILGVVFGLSWVFVWKDKV